MTTGKDDKTDSEQLRSILNLAQKFIVRVQTSATSNYSIDITAANIDDEADRPDPLRVPELLIVACVLLLWCASIFIFIRHSELLRIRHRDTPFRSGNKPPLNLNSITVVDRTSDMVIHPKRRQSSIVVMPHAYNQLHDGDNEDDNYTNMPISPPFVKPSRQTHSFDFTSSHNRTNENNEFLLDPFLIPSTVRRSLLDLHRKSSFHCAINPMSYYSTVDISRRKSIDTDKMTVEKRYIQESPL